MTKEALTDRLKRAKPATPVAAAVPPPATTPAPKPKQQPCSVYFMGADSTGKSELVKYVARAYGMRKVPETEAHYEPGKLRTRLCPHLGVPKPDTVGK